jgi:hypothetical protein
MRALLSVFALLLIGLSAHAQIYHGNDTITLSVGNEAEAHQIAAEFCARGDKYRITRVHGRYGDEIAVNCLWAAPPAPRSASVEPGQPTTNPITELSAQLRRALATPSADAQPPLVNPLTELSAQFRRALATLSAEMPEGETEPPARPEHDGTVTWNAYAQPW